MRRFPRFALCATAIATAVLWLPLAGAGSSGSSANALLQGTCIWQSLSWATAQRSAGPATVLSPLTFDGASHVRFGRVI